MNELWWRKGFLHDKEDIEQFAKCHFLGLIFCGVFVIVNHVHAYVFNF